MTQPTRIYLDNAATSWPKPEAVYEAVERYQRTIGASAGRSVYREAGQADQLIEKARRQTAALIGAVRPEQIVFALNGTDALNLALHGVLRAGDHVVTSVAEHNSVLRPLRHLEEAGMIEVTRVDCDSRGLVCPDDFRTAVRSTTRLFALLHASNVTGAIQPVREVGQIARQRGIRFLVDAAQSLGHVPVDVKQLGADLLAAPGHKGVLGPLGTGILYISQEIDEEVHSVRQGGTGTQSEQDRHPSSLPDKYESGSHNVPGLAGLGAALDELSNWDIEAVRAHEQDLTRRLIEGLKDIRGVTIHGPAQSPGQVGVVSATVSGYAPQEVAAALDVARGIQVRSGLHCAPRMHLALNTAASGGTVRFSLGLFNTQWHVEQAVSAVADLASSTRASFSTG